MNQILGYKFNVNDWGGKYSINFDDGTLNPFRHLIACVSIADKLNVPRDGDKIYWNNILLNFGFIERHLTYLGYMPLFNSKHNLKSFVILLNSNFLILIQPE